jgi:hypothetical protein
MIGKANTKFNMSTFRHPKLSDEDHTNGCKLGIDTWADTCCAGKHAFVEEFIVGKTVTATGFTSTLGSVPDLPVANVLYAYDTSEGTVLLLECNNSIYLGDKMGDSLMNPIQAEEVDVRVDTRPKRYYPHEIGCQCLTFQDGTIIPVIYDGVLPYVPIRRPTKEEVHSCRRLELSSRAPWDPFLLDGHFSTVINGAVTDVSALHVELEPLDPVASELMSTQISTIYSLQSMIEYNEETDGFSSTAAINSTMSDSITPEELSRRLCIGLKTAARTLKATSHQYIRTTGLLSKRFRTDKAQLRYKQLSRQYGTFYTDFLKVAVKSIRGYIGGVIYTNKAGFKKFFPCESEKGEETGRSLRSFIEIVGLPFSLHSDNHSNFKEGFFKKMMRKFGIYQTFTEPHSPWQNRAEPAIGEVKAYARRLMQKTNTPVRLWCFCYEYSADLLSLLATGRYDLQGRTSYEVVMHYTPDISEYVSYTWFQWCHYFDESTKSKRLCRWLGPAHEVGQSFCSYILLDNAEYIARSSVVGLEDHQLSSDAMKEETTKFMSSVEEAIGNHRQPIFDNTSPSHIYFDAFYEDHDADDNALPYGDELVDAKTETIDDAYIESLDEYIGSQIVIPNKEAVPVLAIVKKRKRDALNQPIGTKNDNPILDSRIYELEFPDGRIEEYSVNVIAENLFNMADDDGWDTGLLEEIIDFRKDDSIAIKIDDGFKEMSNGDKVPVITTKGWDVQVRWSDKSTDWIPLTEIKESNPIEIAEASIAFGINKEPAFNWWVHKVLKRRDRMIKQMKAQRCRKGRMKFGVMIPGTVEEAIELDRSNGNTFWQDAIKLEMTNSRVAFKLKERGEKAPVGYTQITCHLIFDLKLDMTRKARYVAGGHLTDVPTYMTYSSVVSRDTVRIGFLMAALNNLDILAGDIQNVFLEAPTKEKIFFYAGEEWKSDKGKVVIVVRALYGLKSSALQFRNCLAETLGNRLGFKSSLADPDLWYKPMTSKDGFEYYAYILVYVDDLLIIHKDPKEFMTQIQESFTVKPSSIGEPKSYLGADIGKVYYEDGSYGWTMGSETYTTQAIKNLKKRMEKEGYEYNKKLSDVDYSPKQPFSSLNYRPEMDVSDYCSDSQTQFFQNLIGILRWTVELGRIDIAYEVSVLSRYLAQPRTGHFVQALHIFKYLDLHKANDLAFDPAYHDVEDPELVKARISAMKEMYPDAIEDLPPNAPPPRGNPVEINCFVDSDHAGDKITRRSQTGILLYLNSAPIIWYSKRQSTVESSTFGSEFVALRVASELIISLRYKLRMFGIPIIGPTTVFCDNEAVYNNATFAESTLKKKHNSICFHRIRECVAAAILVAHKVDSKFNLSDILTKSLPGPLRKAMRERIMFIPSS